jgi:hypothetical protein
MRINLLGDYRGVLTDEEYYTAGQYETPGMMPDAHAKNLLGAGRAVALDAPEVAEPVRRVSRTKRKASK